MKEPTPANLRARQIILDLRAAHASRLADAPEFPESRQVYRAKTRRFIKSITPRPATAARERFEAQK